jgi:predicted dehydrogenase
MYLRSDEKTRGFDNFCGGMASKPLRRKFLQDAMVKKLTPSSGLNAYYFHYEKPAKPLVVGVIGTGRQGAKLLASINPAYVTVKSIADIRPSSQAAAKALVKDATVYDDYKKLIDAAKADGLQGVIIALPSHLHAAAALAAMKAKLHVFVETPMALKVAEAKEMVVTARKEKLCLAVGQQRRYNILYDNALEMARSGLLSDVHYVRAQWHVPPVEHKADEDTNKSDKLAKKPKWNAAKDDNSAIDLWRSIPSEDAGLNVKDHGYESVAELINWQITQSLSGGLIAELGSQLFDAAAMFLAEVPNRDPAKPYPLSVSGSASQLRSDMGDIDDHVHCVFEYAAKDYVDKGPQKTRKKIGLQYDLIVGNEFDLYGETILGTHGSLILESEKRGMLFHMADTDKRVRVLPKKDEKSWPLLEIPKDGGRGGDEESESIGQLALSGIDSGLTAELEHWAVCSLSPDAKSKPRCDGETALATTVMAVAATKAIELGTRVNFEDAWFDAEKKETPDDLKAG